MKIIQKSKILNKYFLISKIFEDLFSSKIEEIKKLTIFKEKTRFFYKIQKNFLI